MEIYVKKKTDQYTFNFAIRMLKCQWKLGVPKLVVPSVSEKYPSNFDFLGMAAKKVDALEERLKGEMNQIKETVEERMSSMEGQVADLRDMMKKMLEFQTQSAASDAKRPEAKNINSEIHRKEDEVEIVDGRRGRPHLEPFQREERGGGYGERNNETANEYINRILYQLTLSIEEHILPGHWYIDSRPPTSSDLANRSNDYNPRLLPSLGGITKCGLLASPPNPTTLKRVAIGPKKTNPHFFVPEEGVKELPKYLSHGRSPPYPRLLPTTLQGLQRLFPVEN
ncbi:hypothetical protein M5K25_010222 [Dendrobium thyrsiflorum]|uniref:Uncharacterized protein n=1 Tax=Dendrobium thyrsiflorum TaxID=117978 RepID=A0ABD0V035_DENTH